MAEPTSIDEPGAPIAKDAIDPDLIKLSRSRSKIGIITAAGVVFLCAYFLVRLGPDRRFGGGGDPAPVAVADVVGDKVSSDQFVSFEGEPLLGRAVRVAKSKGVLGMRLVPMRGTNDKLWLALPGDGWERPASGRYVGRLRDFHDLPFADAATAFTREHPLPVFASAEAVRGAHGQASPKITTVSGDTVEVRGDTRVAYDVIDPAAAIVVATLTAGTEEHAPLMTAQAWIAELAKHGITARERAAIATDAQLGQVRFDVALSVPDVTKQLEVARLWAARVEPVAHHHETTWAELAKAPPATDLVGLYVKRDVPATAYVLFTAERPADYWYVLPITIGLGVIGLLFLWALVRAVRRDLLPTRA